MAGALASMGVGRKFKVMVAMKQTNELATSYSSGEALDWIHRTITKYFRGPAFKLYLIHVQVPTPSPIPRSTDEWSEDDKRRGRAFLTSLGTRCTENNIEFVPMLKRGCPKKEICAAVEDVKPDLLVLGNRGLGGFRRLFVTSVNEYCSKHAECAILTIKPNPPVNPVEPNPNDPVKL